VADKYGISFAFSPIDNEAIKATPVPDDAVHPVFSLPSTPNVSAEVYSVSIMYNIVPVDASHAFTADLIFHDASADSDTVLADDVDMKSTNTAILANEMATIWTGLQRLDPGDSLRLAFTITTPDTAGLGGITAAAYRVKEWAGQ
jgi:hypothetical protein